MFWNSKNSTYYDKGKRAYGFGAFLPESVIEAMGEETLKEYTDKGLIADQASAPDDNEREVLLEKAKSYGLKPHPRTGIAKLEAMIEDYEALQALKAEALALGIDPSDDVGFADLSALVEEKKAEDESDS